MELNYDIFCSLIVLSVDIISEYAASLIIVHKFHLKFRAGLEIISQLVPVKLYSQICFAWTRLGMPVVSHIIDNR